MKRQRLAFTNMTTDEALKGAAMEIVRSKSAKAQMYRSEAEELYDQIVAIHEARKAIRRANARRRGSR